MKLSSLLEAGEVIHAAKLAKVKSFLKPENIQAQYDLICKMLAKYVPRQDLDTLHSQIDGTQLDAAEIQFFYKLLLKQLGKVKNVENLSGHKAADGSIAAIGGTIKPVVINSAANHRRSQYVDAFYLGFHVQYTKSRWTITHDKVGASSGKTVKRVEDAKDVVPYLNSVFASFEKFREKIRKKYEDS